MKRILTGIQSTATPHLGNILGAILPGIELSKNPDTESFFFIADLHSITQIKDPTILKENVFAVAAAWIAFGFDYKKGHLYRQSDIPEVCELAWYLACFTPYPMLANAHSFKDKANRLHEVNGGLFFYPVLMAADILICNSNIVPVGKDQIQHLEITRDIATIFNQKYGETFVVPEMKIKEETMNVPGIDGQKMSKSYNNYIDIFAPEKELKKRIFSIVTNSQPVEESKNPDICNVFKIYKLIAEEKDVALMRDKYVNGGFGYGDAKKLLFQLILDKYKEQRFTFSGLMNDKGNLESILNYGAGKTRPIAIKLVYKVREKLGFNLNT